MIGHIFCGVVVDANVVVDVDLDGDGNDYEA